MRRPMKGAPDDGSMSSYRIRGKDKGCREGSMDKGEINKNDGIILIYLKMKLW